MDKAEFDKYADEYKELNKGVIGISGEKSGFFAEYKVKDTAKLIRKFGFKENLSILDFGSGIGESVPFFLRHLPGCQLTCLDVSRKSLNIAADRFNGQASFLHFNGERIPLADNSFDVVFTACVFHHIPPVLHHSMVLEISRVLKPGGIFIAFEHNPYNFLTVRSVNACAFDEHAILIRGRDFRKLLSGNGLVEDKLHYRIFFPGILRFLRPLEKFMRWLPLGAQYYVYAKKPD